MKNAKLKGTKRMQKLSKKRRRSKSAKRRFKGGGDINLRLWPIRSLYQTTDPSEKIVTIVANTGDTMKTLIEKMKEQIPSLNANDIATLEKDIVLYYNHKQIFGAGDTEANLSKKLETVFPDSVRPYDVVWRRTIMS